MWRGEGEVKIKGLRVPLDKEGKMSRGGRKDSVMHWNGAGNKEKVDDRRKWITGARIEFANMEGKQEFISLVKDVQRTMVELPDLLGVN